MKKFTVTVLVGMGLFFSSINAHAFGTRGNWIASGGFGLTISPTLLLLSPQLEYVQRGNLFFGPMVQMGLGSGVLFTGTATGRFLIGKHPRVKPSVEGGLGIALASASVGSAVGIHILLGMGLDYIIDRDISIGTMIRANFAPPLTTFFASWPLIVARFAL